MEIPIHQKVKSNLETAKDRQFPIPMGKSKWKDLMDGWRLAASPGTNSSHQWLLLIVWEQCRYHANCQDVVDVPEMLPEMASWEALMVKVIYKLLIFQLAYEASILGGRLQFCRFTAPPLQKSSLRCSRNPSSTT